MRSTEVGYLPLPGILSREARTERIFDEIKTSSLLSLGQLPDVRCKVKLNIEILLATKHNNLVMIGNRNKLDRLYDVLFKRQKKKPTMKKPYDIRNV